MTLRSDFEPTLFSSPRLWITALAILLIAGLGIRLVDLTDLPLDFHPTRQLLSAIKARGMYYQGLKTAPEWQRDFAVSQWRTRARVEPELLERLVALTYRATGEYVLVARVYSAFFWTVGALFVFLIARRLGSIDVALTATAVHLFLPYGLVASRSFQPDPLMVTLILVYLWALTGWAASVWRGAKVGQVERERGNHRFLQGDWRLAALAGLAGGLAIYVKFVAAFLVISAACAVLLGREPLRKLLRRGSLWLMAGLGLLPGLAYLVYGLYVAGFLGQQFEGRFFPDLFLSPAYYAGWISVLNTVISPVGLLLSLLGMLLARRGGALRLLMGLWVGYVLSGLYFNYHISTHDYYSLPLVPIAALSIGPVGALVLSQLVKSAQAPGARAVALAALGVGLIASLLALRSMLTAVNYRSEADMWAEIGTRLGRDARVVALTQDYGMRLIYWGWLAPTPWPFSADLRYRALRGSPRQFEQEFSRLSRERDFFLVTDFGQLSAQPELRARLASLPLAAQADDYVIYDLRAEQPD